MESRAVTVNQTFDEKGGSLTVVRLEGKDKDGVWKPIGFDPDDPEDIAQVRENMRAFRRRIATEMDDRGWEPD